MENGWCRPKTHILRQEESDQQNYRAAEKLRSLFHCPTWLTICKTSLNCSETTEQIHESQQKAGKIHVGVYQWHGEKENRETDSQLINGTELLSGVSIVFPPPVAQRGFRSAYASFLYPSDEWASIGSICPSQYLLKKVHRWRLCEQYARGFVSLCCWLDRHEMGCDLSAETTPFAKKRLAAFLLAKTTRRIPLVTDFDSIQNPTSAYLMHLCSVNRQSGGEAEIGQIVC
jgi:hypothetical protein